MNTFTANCQSSSRRSADTGGHAVVVWASQNGFASPDWTIFAKRYSAASIPLSGDLQVSQRTTGVQDHPVVAVDPQGNFIVTWAQQQGGRCSPISGPASIRDASESRRLSYIPAN